jgi:DNA-binding CsgD family transcriptional regulator
MPATEDEKKAALLKYAERFPINDLPGFTNIVSPDSKYIKVSDSALQLIGYKSQDQIFETTYANIPCQACENAETFEKEDKVALEREVKILSYHCFDDWKILLGHKKPIWHNGEVIGTIANFMDVTSARLVDLGQFLLQEDHKIKRKQFSYVITENDNCFYNLTQKEQACLFYFVRGLTFKEIAYKLTISITTVHTHIEHIKQKLNVITRSQLIEKALHLGFLSVIPRSLLK